MCITDRWPGQADDIDTNLAAAEGVPIEVLINVSTRGVPGKIWSGVGFSAKYSGQSGTFRIVVPLGNDPSTHRIAALFFMELQYVFNGHSEQGS